MSQKDKKFIESFTFKYGMDVDLDEGYRKLITSQFGGNPGRGFSELIQNFIDSYPGSIPIEERKGEIETGLRTISMKDYGVGLDRKKLELLLTLGGTDKDKDSSTIGMFGIGFFSIFNPKLGTKNVRVKTICEGHPVQLDFIVNKPSKRPEIQLNILDEKLSFSTHIEVHFHYQRSVDDCLAFARDALRYYPCEVKINGEIFESIWKQAKQYNKKIYKKANITGYLKSTSWKGDINLLCKYENLGSYYVYTFLSGSRNVTNNLDDYDRKSMPYIKHVGAVINNNDLRVTISRDGYYLDYNWELTIDFLREMMMDELYRQLKSFSSADLELSNQYIMRHELKNYLNNPEKRKEDTVKEKVIKYLAESKRFRIMNKRHKYSLLDIKNSLSEDLPLFFTPNRKNLNWLGGNYLHDYILARDSFGDPFDVRNFYDKLLGTIFSDVVNLDTIQYDDNKLSELVKRKIVNKEVLSPKVEFIKELQLKSNEIDLLNDIEEMFSDQEVIDVIGENINLNIKNIKPIFFKVDENSAYISTGIFNMKGEPFSGEWTSNVLSNESDEGDSGYGIQVDILLGLRIDHPFIQYLMGTKNRFKAYYTLNYLANELVKSQKLLVPYSPFFDSVRTKTSKAMRTAMIKRMLKSA